MPSAVNKKRTSAPKTTSSLRDGTEPAIAGQSRGAFLGDVASFSETAMRIVAGARWVEAARRDTLVRNPDGSESRNQHPEGLAELSRRARSFGRFMADQINGPHGADFLRLGAESVFAATEMDLGADDLAEFPPPSEVTKNPSREDKASGTRHGDETRRKTEEPAHAARPAHPGIPRDPTRLRVLVRAGIILRKDPGHRFLVREVRSWFVNTKEAPSGKTIQRMIKELNLKPASRGAPRGTLQKRRQ